MESEENYVSIGQRNGQAERILRKLRKEPITLEWKNIDYTIQLHKKHKKKDDDHENTRQLLSNVSGIARPGELLAIMGSSGAGKTTLLNSLAGRIRVKSGDELSGTVRVNGKPRDARWRRTAGYVEQFDLMYGLLTVQETIQFAADFKLPRDVSPGEKRAIVDRVIELLGLSGVRHSRIGEETKRGISGGEKKRVAIGIELVTFPGLLFLDEPTTGLDSTTAQNLIETLRGIARKTAMTIILTIHQPRASILNLFTRIIFMSQGKLIFNGPMDACLRHLKDVLGVQCPEHENPADFVMDLLTVKPNDPISRDRVKLLQDRWAGITESRDSEVIESEPAETTEEITETTEEITETSEQITDATAPPTESHTLIAMRSQSQSLDATQVQASASEDSHKLTWPNNRAEEFALLLKRNFLLAWRDKIAAIAQFIQTVFISLLLSFVFFQLNDDFGGVQGRLGLLFFISINIVFTTVNILLSVFAVDRAILLRERAGATYRVFPSYSAKFVSLLPQSMLLLIIFATPLYFIAGLTMPFDRFLVFMLMLAALRFASIGMGLCVASISPTVQISEIIGPLVIVIFLIFGGNLANSNTITWILRWIQYISIIFYSYQALAQNEFTGNFYGVQDGSPQKVPGEYYLNLYGLENVNQWGCLGAILGIGLAFLVLGYIGLRISTRPKLTFI